jgi:hypothetical protein
MEMHEMPSQIKRQAQAKHAHMYSMKASLEFE